MVLVNFWRYPDPYQRFLIRIRPDPDPKRWFLVKLIFALFSKYGVTENELMQPQKNSNGYLKFRMQVSCIMS